MNTQTALMSAYMSLRADNATVISFIISVLILAYLTAIIIGKRRKVL